jgi:hypothetical protein
MGGFDGERAVGTGAAGGVGEARCDPERARREDRARRMRP